MNRPKEEDYTRNEFEVSGKYVTDLEKYCDYIENDVIAKAAWKLAKFDKNDIQYWKEWLYDVSRR